ncbi:unnamed protein product [Cuscuta campestris]|uniref:Glutaredoxin domain-containing protein n=2 Tax=Cuscuta sect. Cleistogrammica TaxID=1824901 RepID=A0A484KTS7_9ASTE|nr:hypothetical protein DM860_007140 [Cuscuta australis]VFQ68720.1 unnamed protein product [Cuscuta campestris]
MGCVSSTLLSQDDEFAQIGGSAAFGHHIVSLTSTTYGLLTLDPPAPSSDDNKNGSSPVRTTAPATPIPPTRFSLGTLFASPFLSEPRSVIKLPEPPSEVINSWELMSGLDSATPLSKSPSQSFSFAALPTSTADSSFRNSPMRLMQMSDKENSNPNFSSDGGAEADDLNVLQPLRLAETVISKKSFNSMYPSLEGFEELCPPNGGNKVVIYTTSLRGVRKTFEACSAVRSVIEGAGVSLCERDISMDKGFREELRELMKGKDSSEVVPPRVFVRGRYIGGAEELLKIADEGRLGDLLQGLPKLRAGYVCEGCGGARFLPCFTCNGSCKMVMVVREDMEEKHGRTVVVRCSDCNENGLVLCPICS